MRRLKFIRSAQTSGFTLDEISELLELDQSDDRPRVRALARQLIEMEGFYFLDKDKRGEFKQSFTLTRNGLISITPTVPA